MFRPWPALFIISSPLFRRRLGVSHRCQSSVPRHVGAWMAGTGSGNGRGPDGCRPALLLTNDDGLSRESSLIVPLARALRRLPMTGAFPLVIVAPAHDQSACGQAITLGRPLTVARRAAVEEDVRGAGGSGPVFVFSMDGTPSDCVASAIEPKGGILRRLGFSPKMVISGVNVGSNLGTDVLYSGTLAAARQAAMYGVPAVAGSFVGSVRGGEKGVQAMVKLVSALIQRKRVGKVGEAWERGDVVLNMNVPEGWRGVFGNARIGMVWYREVITLERWKEDGAGNMTLIIGEGKVDAPGGAGSDIKMLEEGKAAVCTVQTWPCSHPLALPERLIEEALSSSDEDGLPSWIGASLSTEAISR